MCAGHVLLLESGPGPEETDRLVVGQQQAHEVGAADGVDGRDQDVGELGVGGHLVLGYVVHPVPPLDLWRHKVQGERSSTAEEF